MPAAGWCLHQKFVPRAPAICGVAGNKLCEARAGRRRFGFTVSYAASVVLVPAFLPGVEVGRLHADACGVSVTGENRSGFGQGEQL